MPIHDTLSLTLALWTVEYSRSHLSHTNTFREGYGMELPYFKEGR